MNQIELNSASLEKGNRMPEQDMAKGILMLLVVFLHSITLYSEGGRSITTSVASVIMLGGMGYAMPVFYILSGYNYRDKGESYVQTLLAKVKQIIAPLFFYTLIIWVVMGIYMICRGETTLAQAVNQYIGFWITDPLAALLGFDASKTLIGQTVGPTWFLKALFSGSIIFLFFAPKVYKSTASLCSVAVLLLSVSALLYDYNINLPWFLSAAPEIAALMLVGCLLKRTNLLSVKNTKPVLKLLNAIAFFTFSFLLQKYAYRVGTLAAGEFYVYGFGLAEVIVAPLYGIFGTYSLVVISQGLKKFVRLSHFLEWFGQRTLYTLILHGPIMRIFSDILGLTGQTPGFSLLNILLFALTLAVDLLLLMLIYKIKNRKNRGWSVIF